MHFQFTVMSGCISDTHHVRECFHHPPLSQYGPAEPTPSLELAPPRGFRNDVRRCRDRHREHSGLVGWWRRQIADERGCDRLCDSRCLFCRLRRYDDHQQRQHNRDCGASIGQSSSGSGFLRDCGNGSHCLPSGGCRQWTFPRCAGLSRVLYCIRATHRSCTVRSDADWCDGWRISDSPDLRYSVHSTAAFGMGNMSGAQRSV
jgi:hypothetical protein